MPVDFLRRAGDALLNLPQLGVIITDINYRIAYWSRGAERLLEIDSDQAVDRQVDQVIQCSDIEPDTCASLAAMGSHQAKKSGKLIDVETTCIPLNDGQHNTAGFLFVMQDITEEKHAERACAKAEEDKFAKDRFMATVAHELRTPLNVILGWVQLFRNGANSDTDISQAFSAIEHNAKSLSRLIEDLVDLSRIVAGNLRLDIRPVGLVVIIDRTVTSLHPVAAAKNIHINKELDNSVGTVAGDADRLQQIVFNLLTNAIKFTPDGRHVEVKLDRADSKARLTVSDTGPGISKEFMPFIFDSFSQAGAANTKRGAGLGLGLAIARHLVELHKGTIKVESSENRGASFIVELPLWGDLLALKRGLT